MAAKYDYKRVSYVDPHPGMEDSDVLYTYKCLRCAGTGEFREYDHIENGICFACRGADTELDYTVGEARKAAKSDVRRHNKMLLEEAKAVKFLSEAAAVRSEWATLTKDSDILISGHGDEFNWIENKGFNRFVFQLWNQMQGFGKFAPKPLSEKQIQAGADAIKRAATWEAEKLEKAEAKKSVAPVLEGKQIISGKIYGAKAIDGIYGTTYKFGIRQVNGQTFWGTIPKKILDVEALASPEWADLLRGTNVVLKATVTPAKDDHTHGFYARPSLVSSDLIPTDS